MVHTCHMPRCHRSIAAKMLMCSEHWAMVPANLQSAVQKHYTPGQEHSKEVSGAYIDAANAAVVAVAQKERKLSTAPHIQEREDKIFAMAKALKEEGVSVDFLKALSLEIAGVTNAQHIRHNGVQTMDRMIRALSETLEFLRKDAPTCQS